MHINKTEPWKWCVFFLFGIAAGVGTLAPWSRFYVFPGFSYLDLALATFLIKNLKIRLGDFAVVSAFGMFVTWMLFSVVLNGFIFDAYLNDLLFVVKTVYLFLMYLFVCEIRDGELRAQFVRGVLVGLAWVVVGNISGTDRPEVAGVPIAENPNVTAMLANAGLLILMLERRLVLRTLFAMLFGWAVYVSYSKAGWIAICIIGVLAFIKWKVPMFFKAVLCAALLVAGFLVFGDVDFDYFKQKFTQSEYTVNDRFEFMRAGFELCVTNPIFGVGIKNTYLITNLVHVGMQHGDNTHNMFSDVCAGAGVIGFGLFLGFLAIVVWRLMKSTENNRSDRLTALGILICATIYLSTNIMFLSQPLYLVLLGLFTYKADKGFV